MNSLNNNLTNEAMADPLELEEGDTCPECSVGKLEIEYHGEPCSCHINPPCSRCVTSSDLRCKNCSHFIAVSYEPPATPVPEGYKPPVYKPWEPPELDPSKIDYYCKAHTHFSMKKIGVYPEGTTIQEVRAVVDGTFGGRFEYFANGKFSFIAYTD